MKTSGKVIACQKLELTDDSPTIGSVKRNTIIPTKYKGELQKHARSKTIEYILQNLRPGDRFFSERDLGEYLGVARITAAKIIQELVLKGVLIRLSKGRAFVSKMPNELGINYLLILPIQGEDHGQTRDHQIKMEQSCLSGLFNYLQDYNASARILNLAADDAPADWERIASALGSVDACVVFYPSRAKSLLNHILELPGIRDVALVDMYGMDPRVAHVAPNAEAGVYEAVHYLHSMRHTKICFYDGAVERTERMRSRFKGFENGMNSVGLRMNNNSVIRYDHRKYGGSDPVLCHERFFFDWLSQNPSVDFTALVCTGDVGAAGAVNALRRFGKRVPEDVSVFGFGNLISDKHHEFFELSSIGVSHFDLGNRTGKLLCDYLKFIREAPESPSPKPFQKLLNTELFIRNTTGKAPKSR